MAEIKYSKPSLKDIEEIKDFISHDSVANANRFLLSIRERINILKNYPEIGRPILTDRFKNIRQLLHKSYRIIYHFQDDKITIITVHHQSRLTENITTIKEYKE